LLLLTQAVFNKLPPSIARFSPEEPDIIVYTGYGMQKNMQFYSLSQRKVNLPVLSFCLYNFYTFTSKIVIIIANELRYDKANIMRLRPEWIQTSLRISPV
jgi:hypothetical protein